MSEFEGIGQFGKPYKVVICDDKRIDQQQVRQFLESRKFEVVYVCENGRMLVDWIKSNPTTADVIILDIIMPVLDGYAAFWELKELNLNPFPRIVFVSVENTASIIKNVVSLGAYDFITKPLKREVVIERVGKVVRRPLIG